MARQRNGLNDMPFWIELGEICALNRAPVPKKPGLHQRVTADLLQPLDVLGIILQQDWVIGHRGLDPHTFRTRRAISQHSAEHLVSHRSAATRPRGYTRQL